MNGFLLTKLPLRQMEVKPLERVLHRLAIPKEYHMLSGNSALYLWGDAQGDVHHASSPNGSLMILHGYLTQIPGCPDTINQKDALKFVLQNFECVVSPEQLADFVTQLNGSFAIFYQDCVRRRSFCVTDRVASRPLWLGQDENSWAVSSNPCALATLFSSVRLDLASLASLLLYGGPVDPSKSLFEGIDMISPGCIIEIQEEGRISARTWYRFHHQPDQNTSVAAWTDIVADRLVQAAERIGRLHSSPTVFFSGGVDSRLTAAALVAAGLRPRLITLGDSTNLEVKVATAAAKVLGLHHQVVIREKHWYLRSLHRAVFETGGSFVWVHGHFSRAVEAMCDRNLADRFLLGDFCEAFSKLLCSTEVFCKTLGSSEEFVARFDSLPLPLYRPLNREATLSLLMADARAEAEGQLKVRIKQRYERLAHSSEDPLIVLDQFFRWQSVATIATFFMFLDLRSAGSECNLMFDREVHKLLEVLPSGIRNEANFGARLISRLNWRAGWVPNSNSLLPVCFAPGVHRLAKRCKPVLGRTRRLILGDSYRSTGSWQKKGILYSRDPEWRKTFANLLCEPDECLDKVLDREAIRLCWQNFLNGDVTRVNDVERLVNLILISRLLMDR